MMDSVKFSKVGPSCLNSFSKGNFPLPLWNYWKVLSVDSEEMVFLFLRNPLKILHNETAKNHRGDSFHIQLV